MGTLSISRELWLDSGQQAARCVDHPFVRALGDGSLPADRFIDYLTQDVFYVFAYARAFAAALARAPDRVSARLIHELLNGTMEELHQLEQRATKKGKPLDAIRPAPATQVYIDLLTSNAFNGSLGELLATMTPCMQLYAHLGQALSANCDPSGPYEDWIRTYASTEYLELVKKMEMLFDRVAEGTPMERDRYRQAMEFEYRFFDAAWNGEMAPEAKEAR